MEAAELTENETDLKITDNLAEAQVLKFVRTVENCDYEQSFNYTSNLANWRKKKAMVDEFQNKYIEEKFNVVEDVTIRQNSAEVLLQMLANNELKDSLILKENIELQSNRKKEQTESMLDDYSRDEINPGTLGLFQHRETVRT